jgi:hypothetical protein
MHFEGSSLLRYEYIDFFLICNTFFLHIVKNNISKPMKEQFDRFKRERKHRFIVLNLTLYSAFWLFFRGIIALVNGNLGEIWAEMLTSGIIFGILIAIYRFFKIKLLYTKSENFEPLNHLLINNGFEPPRRLSDDKILYIRPRQPRFWGNEEVVINTLTEGDTELLEIQISAKEKHQIEGKLPLL